MRRFLLTTAAVATTLVGAACGDSSGLGSNVAGTYELRTINGQSLPVTLGSRTFEAGELLLDSGGEFVETLQFRDFGSTFSTTQDYEGTWERNGSEIELFYFDDDETLIAERTSSSRLVLRDQNGNDWLYQRF
jgi:hypothetical protein